MSGCTVVACRKVHLYGLLTDDSACLGKCFFHGYIHQATTNVAVLSAPEVREVILRSPVVASRHIAVSPYARSARTGAVVLAVMKEPLGPLRATRCLPRCALPGRWWCPYGDLHSIAIAGAILLYVEGRSSVVGCAELRPVVLAVDHYGVEPRCGGSSIVLQSGRGAVLSDVHTLACSSVGHVEGRSCACRKFDHFHGVARASIG